MPVILCRGAECKLKSKCERNLDSFKEWFGKVDKPVPLKPITISDFSLGVSKCDVYIPLDLNEPINQVKDIK